MSKLMIALFVAAGLGLGGCATQRDAPMAAMKPMAPAAPITKDAYDLAVKNADAQYKMDKDACSCRSDLQRRQGEMRHAFGQSQGRLREGSERRAGQG